MTRRFSPSWRRFGVGIVVFTLLAGCAPGRKFATEGNDLLERGNIEGGIAALERAVRAEPDNREYRIQLVRQRELQITGLLAEAERARTDQRFDDAAVAYNRVLGLQPEHWRARAGLDGLEPDRRRKVMIDEAQVLLAAGKPAEAEARARAVLAEDRNHRAALDLLARIDTGTPREVVSPTLGVALRKPVTIEFRDAGLKAVFEALSRSTGVNFVFDREVKPDIKVTVFLKNISVEDAVGVLTVTNQLDKKYLNDNTVMIYPNTAAKQKDYQELNVRTFYLANADSKQMLAMLRTVLKTRDLYADEKLNSITVRDTPDAVRLAEKLINAQDLAESEVTLEVEVLEVQRSRLTELGLSPPTQFTVLNIVPNPTTTSVVNGAVVTTTNPVTTTTQLTFDALRRLTGSQIGIGNPQLNLRSEVGGSNLLANPRIRVKNRDKARILIGDKVPVITTTTTANVGVSESVSYLDVGLKLDVEPTVYLDNEVSIRVGLEVSSIVREVRSATGTLTYQIGIRSATTSLRLRDGETQALAGLINDQERHSVQGFPGFTDLPVLGRLFSSARDQREKSEIVLLITPHVVRNIGYARATPLEYSSGTESAVGAAPLRLRRGSMSAPPIGAAGQAVAPGPTPEPTPIEPMSAPQAPSTPDAAPAPPSSTAPVTIAPVGSPPTPAAGSPSPVVPSNSGPGRP